MAGPWLPLRGFGYRMELAIIPSASEPTSLGEYGFGQAVNEPMVQAQAEGDPAKGSQRDEVAREIDALKTVYFFKVGEAVRRFVAVDKILVHKVSDSPIRTGPDRLRD